MLLQAACWLANCSHGRGTMAAEAERLRYTVRDVLAAGIHGRDEAENDDEMVDPFAAIIDTLSSFLEAGTPLVGDKLAAHVRLAEDF